MHPFAPCLRHESLEDKAVRLEHPDLAHRATVAPGNDIALSAP